MKFVSKNISIGKNVMLGVNVKLGNNVTIYDNVEIGSNTIICNDCVVGEPTAEFYRSENFENPPLVIGPNSIIRSHSIIYAGSKIGKNFQTGHRVTIREGMNIGDFCSIGTLCDLQGHAEIGNYCRLHSNVHIGQKSKLGNFVFIYPYVVLTNDPTPPSDQLIGAEIGDYSQVAVMSVLLPGVKVGRHALVGAGSIVSKNVEDFALVVGNPAKKIKDVREIKNRSSGEQHYPWPNRFSRGMPWDRSSFAEWCSLNQLNQQGLEVSDPN